MNIFYILLSNFCWNGFVKRKYKGDVERTAFLKKFVDPNRGKANVDDLAYRVVLKIIKWPKMTFFYPKMTWNDPFDPKMTLNDPKWPQMTSNDPKITQNDLKWPFLA